MDAGIFTIREANGEAYGFRTASGLWPDGVVIDRSIIDDFLDASLIAHAGGGIFILTADGLAKGQEA
jgi:hypothetical protein